MDTTSVNVRILVVDDEESIRAWLRHLLESERYLVREEGNGQAGLRTFFSWQPDLVILDIMMPRMDGWRLLERIREASDVPVIMLSAVGQEPEKVRALTLGADDYVVKPFGPQELLARVRAVLRRAQETTGADEVYNDQALYVDYPRHRVYVRGNPVQLSPMEFRLLATLVRNRGVVLSADRLLELCWGYREGGPESVRVYIGYLRKKLEQDPAQPRLIETVREFGYRYCPPEDRTDDR